MSRFFDALKEASRSRPTTNGSPVREDWEALTSNGNGLLTNDLLTNDLLADDLMTEALASAAAPRTGLDQKSDAASTAELPRPELTELLSLPEDRPTEPPPQPQSQPPVSDTRIVFDPKARLITNAANSVVAEYYRRLRTKILQQQATKPFRSLLVASPSPQEGKTVTVLNLGLSFATLPSFKVLVVDGDLRRGNMGKLLGVEHHPGLTDLLDGSSQLKDVVMKCDDIPLYFMSRGESKVPPAELLHSPQLGKQFRRLSEQFDLVLVDSAPVNLITDTQLLAGSCDAVLFVARAFSTTRKSLELAIQDMSQFRIIGSVLNGGPRTQVYRRYKGYY